MYAAKQIPLADVLEREAVTAAAAVLREAVLAYDLATADWYAEREAGGIVKADAYAREAGVSYVAVTFDGGRAMTRWQRARAELAAAVANRRAELGDTACRSCAGKAA